MINIFWLIADILCAASYLAWAIILMLQNKRLKEQNATLQKLLNEIVGMGKKDGDPNV